VKLCTVCTRDYMLINSLGGSASPDYSTIPPLTCSQRSFNCVACITKYSFEIESQLMIMTMSNPFLKFLVFEMDAGTNLLCFLNINDIFFFFNFERVVVFRYCAATKDQRN
jgi:hypothetical protein